MKERIIVGISGASGIQVAIELLRQLKENSDIEVHLIYSKAAQATLKAESSLNLDQLHALADCVYDNNNIGSATASGSFKTKGMIIVPCSMKTLAGIACGYSENLLLRTADVMIKERRPLILGVRECPFSAIHLENMHKLSMMGVVIAPLVLSFYNQPKTPEDFIRHLVGKMLDQLHMEGQAYKRWEG